MATKKAPPAESHPKVTKRKITDYSPAEVNPNKGNERGLQMIEKSLSAYGAGRSIVVDKDNEAIGGSHTIQAAVNAGITDVIEVETDGTQLVVVKRTDLDLTSDPRAQGLQIVDNRSTEIGYVPDNVVLAKMLTDIGSKDLIAADAAGFTADEIAALIPDQPEGAPAVKGQLEISAELFERHDYILFVFDNAMDWNVITEYFRIGTVKNVPIENSSIAAGKRGTGRVLHSRRLIEALRLGADHD